jgi:hypothetical protein
MYEAFQAREAELTLKPETPSPQADESSPEKIQPPPGRRTTHSIPIILFLSGFLLYAGSLLAGERHRLPSNIFAWTAWTVACITCFLLTEGLILWLAIALRKRAEQLLSDERLNVEPETIQTRRLLRRAISFWRAHYVLSLPVFTFLVPLWVMTLCQPLQLWLQSQMVNALKSEQVLSSMWHIGC